MDLIWSDGVRRAWAASHAQTWILDRWYDEPAEEATPT